MSQAPQNIDAETQANIDAAERHRTGAGGVHPRAVAAAEQLGPVGRALRGQRLHGPHPGWPDDPETVAEANAHPEVFANKTVGQVADHYAAIIEQLDREARRDRALVRRPAHPDRRRTRPVGGIGGDRPGALPRRAAAADLGTEVGPPGAGQSGQPAPRRPADLRPVPLRVRQRRQRGARPSGLYETYAVPASGAPIFQAATANLNPWTEAKVDSKNPDRGPLLIISGEKDHTVPRAIANASFKKQQRNDGRHRVRRDARPWALTDHRQRMARGRRHRAGVRPTVRQEDALLRLRAW